MRKINFVPFLLLLLSIIFLTYCSTPQSKALQGIQVGMDKSEVLNIAGNPAHKGRTHGQDRWDYVFNLDSKDHTTSVFFAEGRVTYVGPKTESPVTLEKKQEKPAGSFKSIDQGK